MRSASPTPVTTLEALHCDALPDAAFGRRNAPKHRCAAFFSRSRRGFTLVEIMIVVVLIGLLAALAIPAYQRVSRRAQNSTIANDFRVFAQAFEVYASQNGAWPPNATPGVVPVGMTGADFKVGVWQTVTPIGGQWNWDDNLGLGGFTAGISISNFTCDDQQLAQIDALIDDGNLTTGNFQKISSNRVTMGLQ